MGRSVSDSRQARRAVETSGAGDGPTARVVMVVEGSARPRTIESLQSPNKEKKRERVKGAKGGEADQFSNRGRGFPHGQGQPTNTLVACRRVITRRQACRNARTTIEGQRAPF